METLAECPIVWWIACWSQGTDMTVTFTPGVLLEEGAHRTDLAISKWYNCSYRIAILLLSARRVSP